MLLSLSPNNIVSISKDNEYCKHVYNMKILKGVFATTDTFSGTSSILHTITDDTRDLNDIEQLNPANLADANALEYLLDSSNALAYDQLMINETVDLIPQPNQTEVLKDQANTVDLESVSIIMIKSFPFSRLGVL